MFSRQPVFDGIEHITDEMGVSMTLLHGNKRVLLFDTGYGTEDVSRLLLPYGELEQTVLLSHGHHDHILGSRWFRQVYLRREDSEEYRMRTGIGQREKVAVQARDKGVKVPPDFLTASYPEPIPFIMEEVADGFPCRWMDLGGLSIRVYHVPGHTPGSLMIYCPEQKLLLTGDNWNPCTWLWFPSSVPANVWRNHILALMERIPFEYVLCSHQPGISKGDEMRRLVASLTDERLEEAEKVDMDGKTDTRRAVPDGQDETFVFDWRKWKNEAEKVTR